MVELPITFTGTSASSATVRGAAFMVTSYSSRPILAVPEGSTRFWRLRVSSTTDGDSPFACSRRGLRSTMIWRCLPP